jgi:tRNA (cytidine/uridine-2'-O-)-methyltransferase
MTLAVGLHEPLIPANTGNIARLCAAFQTPLHLIHPLGFEITEKRVKRAGLDYWPYVDLHEHDSLKSCLKMLQPRRLVFIETYGETSVFDFVYKPKDFLIFGKETSGLSWDLINSFQKTHDVTVLRIPQSSDRVRSLNLSNSVAITLSYASQTLIKALAENPAHQPEPELARSEIV